MAHKKILAIRIYLDDVATESVYEDDRGKFIIAHINAGKKDVGGVYITQLLTREYLSKFKSPPKNIIGMGKVEEGFEHFIKRNMGEDFYNYIDVKINPENL